MAATETYRNARRELALARLETANELLAAAERQLSKTPAFEGGSEICRAMTLARNARAATAKATGQIEAGGAA